MGDAEGTIYQRGPQGQVPEGQSINGQEGAYGNIPLNRSGQEHVTMYGQGQGPAKSGIRPIYPMPYIAGERHAAVLIQAGRQIPGGRHVRRFGADRDFAGALPPADTRQAAPLNPMPPK